MNEDNEELEDDEALTIEEELLGRHIRCTCDDDPNYCEKHNNFG